MKIAIFDTECNTLDTAEGFVQELAWAIYDVKSWRLLKSRSHLLKWNKPYEVEPGAFAATNLSREFCEQHGTSANYVMTEFLSDVHDVDYVCGHNAISYDIPMMKTNIMRSCFFDYLNSSLAIAHPIDTLIDCPFPETMKIHALKYLAYDHGFILSDAHQALADVFACKAVLSSYDFDKVLEISKTPMVTLTTKIDWRDLDNRARIKNARFYWDNDRKVWKKNIREFHLTGIQLSLGDGIQLERESLEPTAPLVPPIKNPEINPKHQ